MRGGPPAPAARSNRWRLRAKFGGAFLCAALLALCTAGRAAPLPFVVPVPKHITAALGFLHLSPHTVIVVRNIRGKRAAESVQAQVHALQPELLLPLVRRAKPGQTAIVFCTEHRVPHSEGYKLRVGPHGAIVTARDERGLWYGAQTLCQLIERDAHGICVPAVRVDDWPTLSYRGALLFVGKDALPFHRKLMARVLARLKFNAVLLECEGVAWNALGQDTPKNAMSKADLRADIAFANAQGLSVTPLIEGIGHMGWLLNAHPEWAEDPQTPYAINTANPDAERKLFAVLGEALQTFHAPALCIGGDEVSLRGRYPFRSRSRYPTLAEAFTAQVKREYAFLRKRGVRTQMWGDMLLAPGDGSDFCHAPNAVQARQIRAALPKDVQILDWHYGPAAPYNSLNTLRGAGFGPVIGATWANAANIAGFSRALAQKQENGLLQTIWAGYNQNENNLRHESAQFAVLVVAADAAWNGGHVSPLVSAHADALFWHLYGPRPHP